MSETNERTNLEPALRVRGTMLWFNGEKNVGALQTHDGERMDVPGTAFAAGQKPLERCAGRPVEFEVHERVVRGIVFLPEPNPRRARLRRRR